jgi:hypothetical protein
VSGFTESVVEEAALDWLAAIGWTVKHGPEIASHARGEELGLSEDELAFYDALETNDSLE